MTYQLRILQQWKIHNIFHVSLLTPYKETEEHGPNYHKPPPDIIEGELEWEVEQIMGARRSGQSRQLQYQVRWTGYSDAHDTWETADDVHAPQLAAEFWKGNQALAQQLAYKPTPLNEEKANSLSISLMTTHGTDQQPHSYPSRVTSDEEHPHPTSSDHGGSHAESDPDGGQHLLQYRPPTPYAHQNLANGHSVRGLTLEADTGDDPA